jgi:hypothetical protein
VPYLFLAVGVVAIAAFASPKVSLSLLVCVGIVISVVRVTATTIMGPVSFGAAARSVVWASVLPALVLFALLLGSDGKVQLEGLAAVIVLLSLFASFILGFKFSLGASFGTSTSIAIVSTLVAAALLYTLKPLLF